MEAEKENRKTYETDTAFINAEDQWPEEVTRNRDRNRPRHTVNRLKGVTRQIINDYRQNRTCIKVLPANSQASEETAEIIAGLIRGIESNSSADMVYTKALTHAVEGGFGYFRIVPEYANNDVFEQDLVIKAIYNPLSVYIDPDARAITREDMKWCFISEMVNKDEFRRKYPKAKGKELDGFDDWKQGDEIRVCEYYEKIEEDARLALFSNGMVMEITDESEIEALAQIGVTLVRERTGKRCKIIWRKITASEILDTREYNASMIPVVAVIGDEVNIKNEVKTRGAAFFAKDAQRMFNYWRSAATESVALGARTQWLVTPAMIEGFEGQWQNINTAPQPYLLFNRDEDGGEPRRQEPPSVPIGELSIANNASDDIKATTGMYDASLGARGNETSGRAIVARQQEGDTATFQFIDNHRKSQECCGRILIDWMPLFYDTERAIRILDLEGNPSTVTVNQEKYDPITGVTQVLNSLVVGKYDVIASTAPSFASQKLELLNALQQILPALPIVGQVAPDLIVKSMPFQGVDEIAERVKRSMPEQITMSEKELEEAKAKQQNTPPPPSPEEIAAQAEAKRLEIEQANKDKEFQLKTQEIMLKHKADLERIQIDAQVKQQQLQSEAQIKQQQLEQDIRFKREELIADLAIKREARAAEMEDTMRARTEGYQHEIALNRLMKPEDYQGGIDQVVGSVSQLPEILVAAQQQAQAVTQAAIEALRQQQITQSQTTQAIEQVTQQNAAAMQSLSEAIDKQTQVLSAPRMAITDENGNIIGSKVG